MSNIAHRFATDPRCGSCCVLPHILSSSGFASVVYVHGRYGFFVSAAPTERMLSVSIPPLRYSQNFLRDPQLVADLLAGSDIQPEDTVYEIGPGKGIITDRLARYCRRVVAIELDPRFVELLQRRYAAWEHVTIRQGDFLACSLPDEPYAVFANIPFSRTQEIVAKLTRAPVPPRVAYLVVQREAAQKFCGHPKEYLSALLLKPWFALDVVHHFKPSDFRPIPNVEAVLLRIQKRGPPLVTPRERQTYRDFVVYSFTTRQPSLDRIWRPLFTARQRHLIQQRYAIDLAAPPSTILFPQWLELFYCFMQIASPTAHQRINGSEHRLQQQQARLHKCHRTSSVQRK